MTLDFLSIDVTKMPKLGFGLMRLPEEEGKINIEILSKNYESVIGPAGQS